jgi:hypothetical protein
MTLQQIYDQAADKGIELGRALSLGQLRATSLPDGRLRLLFALGGYNHPSLFWKWVDGLTVELDRLGFRTADLSAASLPLDEPGSRTSTQQGWLATEATRSHPHSHDRPAPTGQDQPWMSVPDVNWDRQALELWWQVYTIGEIATKLGYRQKTVRNRFSNLRATYGPDTVPTLHRLRKLKVR